MFLWVFFSKMIRFFSSDWALLVGPGYRQKLLPPSGGHIRNVEAQYEREWYQVEECIEVLHHHFEQPGEQKVEIIPIVGSET